MGDEQVYCPLRREWVLGLPEEVVRVQFLTYMLDHLGFPRELMTVEKSLENLPGDRDFLPSRRIDILCYCRDLHHGKELTPLLLIECKAVPITKKALNQAIGYNHFLKAYFICIVNQNELQFGWYSKEEKQYLFETELPRYEELISIVKAAFPEHQRGFF